MNLSNEQDLDKFIASAELLYKAAKNTYAKEGLHLCELLLAINYFELCRSNYIENTTLNLQKFEKYHKINIDNE